MQKTSQSSQVSIAYVTAGNPLCRSGVPTWRLFPLTLSLLVTPAIEVIYSTELIEIQIGGLLSPFQVIRGLFLLAMFLALPGNRLAVLTQKNMLLPLVLLASYALITSGFQQYPLNNIVQGFYFLYIYVTFISALEFSRRGWLSQMWFQTIPWVFLGLVVCSQVLGILIGMAGPGSYALAASGIAGRANSIGVFAVSILPWFFMLTAQEMKHIWGAFVAFGVAVACMRRSAFITVFFSLIVLVVYYVFHCRNIRQKVTLIAATIGVCVGLLLVASQLPIGEAFITRLEDLNIQDGGTASGRTEFMVVALNHLWSRGIVDSIFGEGTGAIADIIEAGWGRRIGAHNGWLDITAAFGVIGLFLLTWFQINVLWLVMSSRGAHRTAAFGAAMVVCIGGLIMDGIYSPTFAPIYIILGCLASAGLTQNYVAHR